jgi:MarR family protease production transcriptional regulator HPr
MHVSTAFNFSKKLEERGLLKFSKKVDDKRNTYVELTPEGEEILLNLVETYEPMGHAAFSGALPLRELYGKFPDIIELMTIVRNIYGDDFMEIFEKSFRNVENEITEENGKLFKIEKAEEELA